MDVSAISISVEVEERDDNGLVKTRHSSKPVVWYPANLPEEVLSWIKSQITYASKDSSNVGQQQVPK